MPEVHYNISPSQLSRWMACPASFLEERKYPQPPSGEAAKEGTHDHTLLQTCVEDDLRDPVSLIGRELIDHEGAFTVDVARANRVKVAIEYVRQRNAEMNDPVILSESLADPGDTFGWDDWKGTADLTFVADELEVADYKGGRVAQDVENNPQLLSYLVGMDNRFLDREFESYKVTIIQPKVYPPITHQTITMTELDAFVNEVKAWREIAEKPGAPFTPGEKQCRWCRAKGNCKAFNEQALGGVAMSFQNIEVANQAADADPSAFTDEKLREFIEGIPLLKQAIVAAEEEALRRFKNGHTVPGLKAVRGRGSRAWAFPEDEMEGKLKRMGIPKASIFVTKLVSPAQAEKLTWEKRDGTRKTLSARQLKTLESDYIKKTQGKLTIVPESDERDAVVLGAESLFKPVIEPEPVTEIPAWLVGE